MGTVREALSEVAIGDQAGDQVAIMGGDDRDAWVGFHEIVQGSTLVDVGGTSVVVCHFPYRGDSQHRDRFIEHRPADKGKWLLHGHVHDRWAQGGRMINVGVDATRFSPINTEGIARIIRAGPATKPVKDAVTGPQGGQRQATGPS